MTNFDASDRQPAVLVTEDGKSFQGISIGAKGEVFGEANYFTGMTGYQEMLTNPSNYKQVVITTSPHIGNSGWNDQDNESERIQVAGLVVRDFSRIRSNWRSTRSFDQELASQGVVGIAEVDTRALTRHLREHGAMRVGISTSELDPAVLLQQVKAQPTIAGSALYNDVTRRQPDFFATAGEARHTVVAYDFGIRRASVRALLRRGIDVHVVAANTDFSRVGELAPHGVFFSSGPGDPATATDQIKVLKQILDAGIPFFGVGLGHQIFAQTLGLDSFKLKNGHYGLNQPVKELATGSIKITSQNHSFAVATPSKAAVATEWGHASVTHIGLNDQLVQGLHLVDANQRQRGISFQFYPEASPGTHDCEYLYDAFAAMMNQTVTEGAVHATS
ncbi:MAG: glutamine-hydrolyzing carbamoyl-phosphate synthase small subunit [Propionibacteriaceae bacterium]|nr:glutamine-hydrolyzing carbamoyl-phosphate synthase small subunit [Propionibacteriaceae bacterium]